MQDAEHRGFTMFTCVLKRLEDIFFCKIFLHASIGLGSRRRSDDDSLGGGRFAFLIPLLIAEFLIDRSASHKEIRDQNRGEGS